MYRVVTTGYHKVLFSAGWGTKEAENLFLTHIWESGCWCAGVYVTWLMRFPTFLVAVCHCLTSHPSSFFGVFSWKIVFPFPVCCGEIYLYSVFELLQFSNYFSGLVCLSCYECTLSCCMVRLDTATSCVWE